MEHMAREDTGKDAEALAASNSWRIPWRRPKSALMLVQFIRFYVGPYVFNRNGVAGAVLQKPH